MKSGIDYFPLDVALDSKMELIEAEFGLTGFGVIVKLFGEIYGKQGYYIEWTEEVALLFARNTGLGGSVVSEIVRASIKRGMFDQEIFDKYHVLTSRGIQKRYFEAVSRRKEIEVDNNILLVDPTQICKTADIKRRNVNILSENVNINKQSKVEKSRVKKSKEEESNSDGKAVPKSSKTDFYISTYNAICVNLPKCRMLTDKRKRAIGNFEKQLSKDEFATICQKANDSSFCTGSNDRGWKADFDFLIRADKATNILEGKYDGKGQSNEYNYEHNPRTSL